MPIRLFPESLIIKIFKISKPGLAQDYLYAVGYVDADIIKNTVNVTFGTDKFHIGDGYRSLFYLILAQTILS
ncbi:MAG: hypothetical protein IPN14_10800 [Bacteroidetes bacterium]|nr:hypothetical protein [Bacteroidota bacterium]